MLKLLASGLLLVWVIGALGLPLLVLADRLWAWWAARRARRAVCAECVPLEPGVTLTLRPTPPGTTGAHGPVQCFGGPLDGLLVETDTSATTLVFSSPGAHGDRMVRYERQGDVALYLGEVPHAG